MLGPHAPKRLQPPVQLHQALRTEPVHPFLRLGPRLHEPSLTQNAEVLRDGRLGSIQLPLEVADGSLAVDEQLQNRPPTGLSKDIEHEFHDRYIPLRVYRSEEHTSELQSH